MLDESNNGTTGEIQLSGWFRAQWSFEWSYTRIISKNFIDRLGQATDRSGHHESEVSKLVDGDSLSTFVRYQIVTRS